jgi:predicted RecB family nuclease
VLDAGVVTRCRRRVHLEHDPTMVNARRAAPDPTAEQRKADATAHRRAVAGTLARLLGADWTEVPAAATTAERAARTSELVRGGARYVWGAVLPIDSEHGRRGSVELLVKVGAGYVPVIVVRHKVTDPGSGACTAPLAEPSPTSARTDERRRVRPQPRDQLRLAHAVRLLEAAGLAAPALPVGGVIGLDADAVLWHDLSAPTWPGGRSALTEYDSRFADRMAVATAAVEGAEPLAQPSRVTECRSCPWWPICEESLRAERDVSLVVRGEDAMALRAAGLSTVDHLAACTVNGEPPVLLAGMPFEDAVLLSRAWLADLTLVRRVPAVEVPRADVELDVDMESFGDAGAYLWGCHLSGVDVGLPRGYQPFVTWRPLPTDDEARSFAAFWSYLATVRARAAARGLTFRAFCYNELAENRWLVSSARRFAGRPGIPPVEAVTEFIESSAWVDLFGVVNRQFLCARGKGLKTIAPAAGFAWRDAQAGGENSMRWYRLAVGLDGEAPDPAQRDRLLAYNEDDVLATWTLRRWMSSPEVLSIPYAGDL